MSRLGKKPIFLPKGVEVTLSGKKIKVKGSKGELTLDLEKDVIVDVQEGQVIVQKGNTTDAFHGLYRTLVQNLITGVTVGYEKRLSLVGVGFRAAVSGNFVDLQLGYSHPVQIQIPEGMQVTVEKSILIIINGIDKQKIGQFAATLRSKRSPEPYKGKGIRYENEFVRKKAGKSAKSK